MATNKGAASWGAAAKSTKGPQSATKDDAKSDEDKVITIGKGDYDVSNEDDGDTVALTLNGTEYALDLEAAGNLAEDLVDANPNLEKSTGETD